MCETGVAGNERDGGSGKVTERRENKVSVGDYNKLTSQCLTVISVRCSLPLLCSVESHKPESSSTSEVSVKIETRGHMVKD